MEDKFYLIRHAGWQPQEAITNLSSKLDETVVFAIDWAKHSKTNDIWRCLYQTQGPIQTALARDLP